MAALPRIRAGLCLAAALALGCDTLPDRTLSDDYTAQRQRADARVHALSIVGILNSGATGHVASRFVVAHTGRTHHGRDAERSRLRSAMRVVHDAFGEMRPSGSLDPVDYLALKVAPAGVGARSPNLAVEAGREVLLILISENLGPCTVRVTFQKTAPSWSLRALEFGLIGPPDETRARLRPVAAALADVYGGRPSAEEIDARIFERRNQQP